MADRRGASASRQPQRLLRRVLGLSCLALVAVACAPLAPEEHRQPTPEARASTHSPAGSPSATPSARPTGTRSPNPGGLTDAQMVGQLFMTYVYGSGASTATPEQRAANLALYGEPTGAQVVRRWHLGGITLISYNNLDPARPSLLAHNVDSAGQIRALTEGLQHAAARDGLPRLLISTDQEGGRVQRIRDGVTQLPPQQTLSARGPTALRCLYTQLGRQLLALGVNQDFAPVADVVTTRTGVIGDRSFGPDARTDAADLVAAVAGLQSAGVLATLKHWPGHGSTSTDSHLQLAVIRESLQTWRSLDRIPFAAAKEPAAVMVGHLAFPAADPSGRAATFSRRLLQGLLRRDLGFRGLVVTDSLWMAPARQHGSPAKVALDLLRAGNDLLLEPPDLPASYRAVLHAVRTDPAMRRRVQDAVRHVLAAKRLVGRTSPAPAQCS